MRFDLKPKNINYIKIIYKDSNSFLHMTKAAVKRIDSKEIFASARFEENWFIKTPQDIEVSFICENGLYKARTELKYTDKDDEFIYFALKIPEEVEYRQSREYFRVRLQEKVFISYTKDNQEHCIECLTHDISANGLCVILPQITDFPEEVNIILKLREKDILTKAKFIRTDNEDDILKASFNFENLKERDMDYISQICIQKQIENRKSVLL